MKSFREIFGCEASVWAKAHGRVNLIGEHTDYNAGFVLPTSIPQCTKVQLGLRTDQRVHIESDNFPEVGSYELGSEQRRHDWVDYIQGITKLLRESGIALRGFNALVSSDVPVGSGLSSSAALEVAVLKALREVFAFDFDDINIAKLGQRVENEFVGARVGIMDQMAACLATHGEALFIDTADLTYARLPLPLDRMDLLVMNSGISHRHVTGEYNQRRAQCEEASRRLGLKFLRDLELRDLPQLTDRLPALLLKRVRHVVTENERVLAAVRALREGKLPELGHLLNASHSSLRDDYEVSIPEIDLLVQIAQTQPEVFGARITGGGFGGSIVALTQPGASRELATRITSAYQAQIKAPALTTLVPQSISEFVAGLKHPVNDPHAQG